MFSDASSYKIWTETASSFSLPENLLSFCLRHLISEALPAQVMKNYKAVFLYHKSYIFHYVLVESEVVMTKTSTGVGEQSWFLD